MSHLIVFAVGAFSGAIGWALYNSFGAEKIKALGSKLKETL
jgi:hypothetical protein